MLSDPTYSYYSMRLHKQGLRLSDTKHKKALTYSNKNNSKLKMCIVVLALQISKTNLP